jgi:hypothetical protein
VSEKRIDPACDCPPCPECGLPCGTIDESELLEDWLVCGACGEEWMGTQLEARAAAVPRGEQLSLLGGES